MFRKHSREKSSDKSTRNHRKLEQLILPNAKLQFCPDQLQNLNYMFLKKLEIKEKSKLDDSNKSWILAKSVTERLIQRLLCCVGMMDGRFSSKFLISNNDLTEENNLEYYVRLDCLSTPQIYESDPIPRFSILETDPDYPAGYARLRLHTTTLKTWGDCANPAGYLRRDKVQSKLVELLAKAAKLDTPNSPLNIDESIYCGTPGKIVSPNTLHEILKNSAEEHIFYGPGGSVPRFPDPRDLRLAIIDEPGGIRIKVEFLSPALANISISVRLFVVIGIDFWPSSTDFPKRITLGHSDCLLYYLAAQTGMFLVGYGVQSSAWQIRVPAAQEVILNHYGYNSTIWTILDMLTETLEEIKARRTIKKSYKILNRYIFQSLLFQSLEEDTTNPFDDMIDWSPLYLSTHVLKILDKIIGALVAQNLSDYFFKKSNLLVNPGHLSEDDYVLEANIVKSYVVRLFDEALISTKGSTEFNKIMGAQQTEMILLYKWTELIEALMPQTSAKNRKICFVKYSGKNDTLSCEYTSRQLDYIGLLFENLLKVRQKILTHEPFISDDNPKIDELDNKLEDVIFLLVTIMDQARDKFLSSDTSQKVQKNRAKFRAKFNSCLAKLIETIRKDKDMSSYCFEDDSTLVKVILQWLYKAMEQNKRYLAPILRPYLNSLFYSSHATSWHLDFIKQRLNRDELSALGSFAKLVNGGSISPAEGLIDACNKNWKWAREMMRMVEQHTLRVIFIADRGKVYRHILSMPSYQRQNDTEHKSREVRRQQTLPASNRNYFNTLLKDKYKDNYGDGLPQHEVLKNCSPMNLILTEIHRRGDHRGYGDILKSLQSMHKLNLFQQIIASLPAEDRVEIMEIIHSMQTTKPRRSTARWSNTLPSTSNRSRSIPAKFERYTPKDESAGISTSSKLSLNKVGSEKSTLIGTCRAARIKEDSNVLIYQDSMKIKSLLHKSESFKF